GYRVFRQNSLFWGSPFPVRTPPHRSRLHAGSHGDGGSAARRGRDLERPARPPVRDRRVRDVYPVRSRLPARQPDRGRGPAWLLDHGWAGDRGGRPVHAAASRGRRHERAGVVRLRKPGAELRLGKELLPAGRLLGHGIPPSRPAARCPRRARAAAPRTSGAAAIGNTSGTGAARLGSSSSGPTTTATPSNRRSGGTG